MAKLNKLHRQYITSLAQVTEKWRWALIFLFGLALFFAEVYEFIQLRYLNQSFHVVEVILYAFFIIGTGLFLELFVRSNKAYKQTLKVLEYKHKLSLDLALHGEQESFINRLVELPKTVADVEETYLLVGNSINGRFDLIGYWTGNAQIEHKKWDPTLQCVKCLEEKTSISTFHLCHNFDDESSSNVYSFCMMNQGYPTTILKFKLAPGAQLSQDEEMIFNSIGDEIAVALQVSEDRKRLSELQSAEVALAERRLVSAYVHDQLGQNLGYLHLKLDQLGKEESMISSKDIRNDLKRLREVANDSYEMVRDILKKMQPETIPHLTNLLKEHAVRVSRMANFTLKFDCIGQPVQLLPETQQTIFYVFREVLGNVEKHSKASNVDVLVTWSDAFLDISIADNGVGFEPGSVRKDEHFGLEIMQERIANLKGQLMLNSSADSGTVVSISVPISVDKDLP